MLVSMVIIRYRYLRSLKQLRNEAMARIISKKSKMFKENLINLILCRRNDMKNNNSESKNQGAVRRRWIILKLNFSDLFKIGKLQTLDEKEQEIKEIEKEINKEKIERRLKRIEKYSIK